jgi:hypothetical protein
MIKYDIQLDIATGHGAVSKVWKNKKTNWSNLVTRLSDAIVTGESYKEFINASKQEQGKIKDVGGFVGGYLRNGRRSPSNVVYRQILTLDIDFAHLQFWDDFTLQFDYGAVLHGTHKHSDASPRYRLIIPLNREAKPDEYVAVARQIAGILGIELFDNTTFETNRLMFWTKYWRLTKTGQTPVYGQPQARYSERLATRLKSNKTHKRKTGLLAFFAAHTELLAPLKRTWPTSTNQQTTMTGIPIPKGQPREV